MLLTVVRFLREHTSRIHMTPIISGIFEETSLVVCLVYCSHLPNLVVALICPINVNSLEMGKEIRAVLNEL